MNNIKDIMDIPNQSLSETSSELCFSDDNDEEYNLFNIPDSSKKARLDQDIKNSSITVTEEQPEMSQEEIDDLRKKYTSRGTAGLKNFGCTCYMNSILQCLSHTPLLSAFLREQYFEPTLYNNRLAFLEKSIRKQLKLADDDDNLNITEDMVEKSRKKTVTYTLSETLIEMWRCNRIVIPRSFKDVIGAHRSIFRLDWEQNDSQELLEFVLNRIDEETRKDITNVRFNGMSESVKKLIEVAKRSNSILSNPDVPDEIKEKVSAEYKHYKDEHPYDLITLKAFLYWRDFYKKNYSIITTLFTGMFLSLIECLECYHLSPSFETFNMLSISVPPKQDTTLEDCLREFSKDELLTGENMYNCEKCNKKVEAKKNMFIWEAPEILIIHLKRFNNMLAKTSSNVHFPMNNLKLTDNFSPIYKNENVSYDLYALSEHLGSSIRSGHYISHVKNSLNGRWYECNDSNIFHVPHEIIDKEIRTQNAYLLFYEKKRN